MSLRPRRFFRSLCTCIGVLPRPNFDWMKPSSAGVRCGAMSVRKALRTAGSKLEPLCLQTFVNVRDPCAIQAHTHKQTYTRARTRTSTDTQTQTPIPIPVRALITPIWLTCIAAGLSPRPPCLNVGLVRGGSCARCDENAHFRKVAHVMKFNIECRGAGGADMLGITRLSRWAFLTLAPEWGWASVSVCLYFYVYARACMFVCVCVCVCVRLYCAWFSYIHERLQTQRLKFASCRSKRLPNSHGSTPNT